MLEELKRKIEYYLYGEKTEEKNEKVLLNSSLNQNMIEIKKQFPNSMDLNNREISLGKTKIELLCCEGLVSSQFISLSIVMPLTKANKEKNFNPDELCDFISNHSIMSPEQTKVFDIDSLFKYLMSGFAIILIDGKNFGFAIGTQGFIHRPIMAPTNEANELGPKEAFTEPIRVNLSMIRRRIKSPKLRFEMMSAGSESKTDICLVYLSNKASGVLIKEIKKKINKINLNIILDSSYVRPYLEDNAFTLFSSVGNTERPDVLCGKINEGRVAILVDGSPYALIVPFLFNENFKSFDDYAHRPYFSSFVRIIKYLSFYISFILPGLFVAVTTFHPELLPRSLLMTIASSEEMIPFSLTIEAIFIYLVFEILREAGIRLPNAVGHTIGIVGALVIGDAAVNAGIIGAPMVMIVAITAICAFTVPQLYEPIMVLRFIFILLGGITGLFGIALGSVCTSAVICSMNTMKIPMTAPLSPFDIRWFSDSIIFSGVKKIANTKMKIQNIKGSEIDKKGE